MAENEETTALGAAILAGGVGARAGGAIPKQLLPLDGVPMLMRVAYTFQASGLFDCLVISVHPDWLEHVGRLLAEHGLEKAFQLCPGGATRQASSFRALQTLASRPCPPRFVLIHDAARCLADQALLARCADGVRRQGAITAATPVVDTLAVAQAGRIMSIPDRNTLFRVQTPQGFDLRGILDAHEGALRRGVTDASDDAQLAMAAGLTVHLVEGDEKNIKVSYPGDFNVAEAWLRSARENA